MADPNALWAQRQDTSCGAYALTHALRLASGTLDANRDGAIQQGEWEGVHRGAALIWPMLKYDQGPLARFGYSNPVAIARTARLAGKLEGFYLNPAATAYASANAAMGMPLDGLLGPVVQGLNAANLPIIAADGLAAIQSKKGKYAIAPCAATSYLHYVLFRGGTCLSICDSEASSYRWLNVVRPSVGGTFFTPGRAQILKYLGMAIVIC